MRSNRWMGAAVAVGLLIGLLAIWGPASPGQAPEARSVAGWEYKTIFGPNRQDNDEALNRLGQFGWELVAVGDDPRELVRYVFKRPMRRGSEVPPTGRGR